MNQSELQVKATDGNQLNLAEMKQACIDSYATFACLMQEDGWFDPVHEYLCNWTQKHIEDYEKQLQITDRGMCCLAYVMPRGSLKSTIVTKYLPQWLTIRRYYKFKDDSLRSLIAGNTHKNAMKKLGGIKSTFELVDLFKALFPEILPNTSQDGNTWTQNELEINRKCALDEATFECAGTNTKLTGRHFNVIVEDDTTAPDVDEMKADVTRPNRDTIDKAIGFHRASTPLYPPKGFRLSVVVSTRWAMDDLISYVSKEEDYYTFNMPAVDKSGNKVFTMFYDDQTLALIKKRVGEYMFSMLYLNTPLDDTLRVFKSTDFQWIERKDVPKQGYISIAVDPAISEKDESCETAITVNQHVRIEGRRQQYWLQDKSGHWGAFKTVEELFNLADKYHTQECPVRYLIVETVAYQEALREMIINKMKERRQQGKPTFQVVKHRTRTNKEARIEGMQPAFQEKRIFFIKNSLSDQTESQLLQYPSGVLVDVIDSWSMHKAIWRADDHDYDAHEVEVIKENSFEAAIEEIKNRRKSPNGLQDLDMLDIDFMEGLDSDGRIYYKENL